MEDLDQLGIRLEARGELLWCSKSESITEDLAKRIRQCKHELLNRLEREPCVAMEIDNDGWPIGSFDPPEPCTKCGTLELWQTMLGNWRCERCEPPSDKALEFIGASQWVLPDG